MAGSVFRCVKCGAATSADALQCEACAFVFGSDRTVRAKRPGLVVVIQVVALALGLYWCASLSIFMLPIFAIMVWGSAMGFALTLLAAVGIPVGCFLVFWGLIRPRPWARTAAIAFSVLLCLIALLVAGSLARVAAMDSIALASLVAALLIWHTVVFCKSEAVRRFVADNQEPEVQEPVSLPVGGRDSFLRLAERLKKVGMPREQVLSALTARGVQEAEASSVVVEIFGA